MARVLGKRCGSPSGRASGISEGSDARISWRSLSVSSSHKAWEGARGSWGSTTKRAATMSLLYHVPALLQLLRLDEVARRKQQPFDPCARFQRVDNLRQIGLRDAAVEVVVGLDRDAGTHPAGVEAARSAGAYFGYGQAALLE